ncbi:MAG TPA: hypothetical protein VFH56_12040 [Acidimicrobiales bacterium]|nr:hypothetical protein [Acidimicrobiales bacterium]
MSEAERLSAVLARIDEWLARVDPRPDLNGDQFAELRTILDGER